MGNGLDGLADSVDSVFTSDGYHKTKTGRIKERNAKMAKLLAQSKSKKTQDQNKTKSAFLK